MTLFVQILAVFLTIAFFVAVAIFQPGNLWHFGVFPYRRHYLPDWRGVCARNGAVIGSIRFTLGELMLIGAGCRRRSARQAVGPSGSGGGTLEGLFTP